MDNILGGFMVLGSLYGIYILLFIIVFIITLIWLVIKKGFINALVIAVVISTFAGVGAVIGYSFSNIYLMLILPILLYFGGLFLSLKLLKRQGGKILITNLGDDME